MFGISKGFDVVIGNPPYRGGREWKEEEGNFYDYISSHYSVAEYQFDMYALFWEQGIRLAVDNGMIVFITPNTWLNNQSTAKLRKYILDTTSVISILDCSRESVLRVSSFSQLLHSCAKECMLLGMWKYFSQKATFS